MKLEEYEEYIADNKKKEPLLGSRKDLIYSTGTSTQNLLHGV